MKNCSECVHCELNPYGKGKVEDYNGYHCNWYGKKICDEKDIISLAKNDNLPSWEYMRCLKLENV